MTNKFQIKYVKEKNRIKPQIAFRTMNEYKLRLLIYYVKITTINHIKQIISYIKTKISKLKNNH